MNFARFFVHTVTVETFSGTSSDGDVFASPVAKKCFREDKTRLIRDATGEQIVSQTTLFGPLSDLAAYVTDSRVTLPSRQSRVIVAMARDSGGRFPDHAEIHLE